MDTPSQPPIDNSQAQVVKKTLENQEKHPDVQVQTVQSPPPQTVQVVGTARGEPYIVAENIVKTFQVTDGEFQVLKGINVTIRKGEFVIIFGPSGCGKSTLLHTLLGLEVPTGGKLLVENKNFYELEEDGRAIFRRHNYGIIYQQPLWISSLDVKENVGFSLHLLNLDQPVIDEKVHHALALVRMEHWADYHPTELSSGQQQKISLARSMTLNPTLIVADEPTGNLDTVSGQELINTFSTLNRLGKTIIMVTHDLEYLRFGTHLIHMVDGQVVEEEYQNDVESLKSIVGKRGTTQAEEAGVESNVRDADFLKKIHKKSQTA